MFAGLLKMKGDEQESPRMPEEKSDEGMKTKSGDEFLQSPEAKNFIKEWNNKEIGPGVKFTKRGLSALLRELYTQYKKEKEAVKVANTLLLQLSGKDMFGKLLNAFKLVPEGLRKLIS